jgi:diphosphomevalonate decarboxylase
MVNWHNLKRDPILSPELQQATAAASPNIAFIKYWGNTDQDIRLPANGSISMTLGGLESVVSVSFDPGLTEDELDTHGVIFSTDPLTRISHHLDRVRERADLNMFARVETQSNFPVAAGIASSASVFSALTLAACTAAGLELDTVDLSRLARRGSGSACRSIYGGFVEAYTGENDVDGFAAMIAPADHWNLVDLIAIISSEHKKIGSTAGHALASTSPFQAARVDDASRRLEICRQSILTRNFPPLANIAEQDSNMMHSVMLTSTPPLFYWASETLTIMESVSSWRAAGLRVFYTVDAGPNVHCITHADDADDVLSRLRAIPSVDEIIQAPPGLPARLL